MHTHIPTFKRSYDKISLLLSTLSCLTEIRSSYKIKLCPLKRLVFISLIFALLNCRLRCSIVLCRVFGVYLFENQDCWKIKKKAYNFFRGNNPVGNQLTLTPITLCLMTNRTEWSGLV